MTADELLAFAEELTQIAAAGGGAPALAAHLARRSGAAVLVEDVEWRHVAAAGGAVPPSARAFLDAAASPFAPAPLSGRDGLGIVLAAGETRLGYVSVFGGSASAAAGAVRLAACAIAVELGRASGAGRKALFWEQLASRAYLDAASARDDAAVRGIVTCGHYVAIALELEAEPGDNAYDGSALRSLAAQTFRSSEAETGFAERAGILEVFVPAPREIDAANARTAAQLLPRALTKKDASLRLWAGVGARAPLAEAAASLEQAHAALSIARRLYGAGKVGVYEELGAYPLLFRGADRQTLRAFAERTLAPLRAYDEKHQTELEKTLRLYFSNGENVKTAAAELSVHRHTVFYRLRQIGEICRCNLDDSHDQLTLRMAMAIDALTTD